MSVIEDILVFSRAAYRERTFNPQMRRMDQVIERLRTPQPRMFQSILPPNADRMGRRISYKEWRPIDLIDAPRSALDRPPIMYGQKPVSLMQYLIRTHTNPGDTVLDFTAGGFTTGVAAFTEGRKFILFENYPQHFALGTRRLSSVVTGMAEEAADSRSVIPKNQ